MASEAAALLDQLMGRTRNAVAGDDISREHWSDPDVCKYFLCGFCPSELFTNTRSDIGPCDKTHDEALQIAYAGSSQFGKMGYEDQFLDCLEKTIRDLDKRIQRGKERLARSAEANKKAFIEESGNMYSEKLHELSIQITDLIQQSEELGNQGDVEEAQELILKVEELEKEKEKERSAMMFKANVPQTVAGFEIDPGNFHEKNEICDVCGCFLIIGDTQARMDAHLMGKQHMGFSRIRSKIVELRQAREEKLIKEREERKSRRESKSNRSPHRDRSRERESSRRHSHRSRSRDKGGRRSKSPRDRDRKRGRSRSKERDARKRSGSRTRERERRRRSKSGERRKRSSRSRSRGRERSRSRDSKRRRKSRSRSRERSGRRRDRRSRSRSKGRSRHDKHRSRSRSKERKESNNSSKRKVDRATAGEENGEKDSSGKEEAAET